MLHLGIVGYSLGHTLSPLLHHTLMEILGLAGEYRVYETSLLENMVNQLMAANVTGFNVTIPYKVDMLAYCHELTDKAHTLQSVNTVKRVIRDGTSYWYGDNTDVSGYMASLPLDIVHSLKQRRVLVLGVGGAARSIVAGLVAEGVAELTLVGRDNEKNITLLKLANAWKSLYSTQTCINLVSWNDMPNLSQVDMLINTTPVGTKDPNACPIDTKALQALPHDAFVSDLIYHPLETRLIAESRAAGLAAEGGLGMLVHQGVQAFAWWTNQDIAKPVTYAVFNRLRLELSGILAV